MGGMVLFQTTHFLIDNIRYPSDIISNILLSPTFTVIPQNRHIFLTKVMDNGFMLISEEVVNGYYI